MSTPLDTTIPTVEGDEVPAVDLGGSALPGAAAVFFDGAGDGVPTSADDPLPVKGQLKIEATDFNALVAAITAVREAVEAIGGSTVITEVEDWQIVGASGKPAFQGDWGNIFFAPDATRYYTDPFGRTWVQGAITGTVDGVTPVFTLPSENGTDGTLAFFQATSTDDGVTFGTASMGLSGLNVFVGASEHAVILFSGWWRSPV